MIPDSYKELPQGVRCRCIKLYRAWNGRYWCCNPGAGAEPATRQADDRRAAVGRTGGSIPPTGASPEEKTYLDLFARLDKASEPDRELDLAISLTLWPDSDLAKMTQHPRGLESQVGYAWNIAGKYVVFEKWTEDGRCPHNGGFPLPEYTSSIDDALKLLRKHYLWQLKQGIECTAIVWWLEKDWDDTGAPTAYSTTFPALALAKAALLARAVEDRGKPSPIAIAESEKP